MALHAIELLVFQVPDTRHKIESQQMTERENDFGIPMSIRGMLTNLQDGVIVQEPIKDVQHLTGATRNHSGTKHGRLDRDMGVNTDRLLVVAVIPWVIGREETTGPYPKALRI